LVAVGAVSTLAWSVSSRQPIPGWLATAGGVAAVLLTQLGVVSFLAALSILSARNGQSFLPLRDWKFFVRRARRLPRKTANKRAA
jgi:hypothetical protein